MVRFVLDMCTSIVILAWSCNELRDFVAFAFPEGCPRLRITSRSASLWFMSGSRLVLSVEQNRLFKRLIPFCAASAASRRWRP